MCWVTCYALVIWHISLAIVLFKWSSFNCTFPFYTSICFNHLFTRFLLLIFLHDCFIYAYFWFWGHNSFLLSKFFFFKSACIFSSLLSLSSDFITFIRSIWLYSSSRELLVSHFRTHIFWRHLPIWPIMSISIRKLIIIMTIGHPKRLYSLSLFIICQLRTMHLIIFTSNVSGTILLLFCLSVLLWLNSILKHSSWLFLFSFMAFIIQMPIIG